jgi:hypothetical protein
LLDLGLVILRFVTELPVRIRILVGWVNTTNGLEKEWSFARCPSSDEAREPPCPSCTTYTVVQLPNGDVVALDYKAVNYLSANFSHIDVD